MGQWIGLKSSETMILKTKQRGFSLKPIRGMGLDVFAMVQMGCTWVQIGLDELQTGFRRFIYGLDGIEHMDTYGVLNNSIDVDAAHIYIYKLFTQQTLATSTLLDQWLEKGTRWEKGNHLF